MSESLLLTLTSTLFGLLTVVLGWAGVRMFTKVDQVFDRVSEIKDGIVAVKDELQKRIDDRDKAIHDRITELSLRFAKIEATCRIKHDG